MTPRWKIRREWSPVELGYRWRLYEHGRPGHYFRKWENAILYADVWSREVW